MVRCHRFTDFIFIGLIFLEILYVPVMGYFYVNRNYKFYNLVSKYFQFMFIHLFLVLSYLYLFIYIKIDLKREINKIVKAMRESNQPGEAPHQ